MTAAELSTRPLPAGALVITPAMSFNLSKAGFDVAKFGAYHASQDTRFREFTTGGFPLSSRPEEDYFPRFDRAKVIARGRVMFRNQPHLAAMLLSFVQEIGTPTLKSLTGDEKYDDAKERFFESWSQDCEAEEDLSLDEVVEIWGFERCIAGDMFIIKRREGWLQIIAAELCGSMVNIQSAVSAGSKFADGTPIPPGATEKDGVVRDANRLIIGYRFAKRDAMGFISFAPERSSVVQKQYVIHLGERQRSEQTRGVPLLAPVLNAMQDLFETAHSRAQQVKNASCLSLWITKNLDPYGFAETMRGSLRQGDVVNAAALKEMAEKRSAHQEVKAGAVYYGATGEQLQLIEPKLNAADFHDHYIDLLQVCCACLNGMPVEIAIEGFRNSNYSSSRATVNKWKRNVAKMRRYNERKLLDPLQLWQSRRGQLFGDLPAPPPAPDGATYNTDENIRWGWPAIPDIDGAKTAAQNALELANGTTTRTAIYADKSEYIGEQDKIFAKEKANLLKNLLAEAKEVGLTPASAEAWALAQMPQANAALLAPVIAAALATDNAIPGIPAPAN